MADGWKVAHPFEKLRRRRVRRMRIVKMDPHEERWTSRAFQPRERAIDHGRRRTLCLETIRGCGIARNLVVVRVEPLREAEAAIEDEGTHKRRGSVARA